MKNLSNIGKSIKGYGSKDGAKTILWLVIIGFLLYFSKQIFTLINGWIKGGPSDEEKAVIEASKLEFEKYKQLISKIPSDKALVASKVAEAQNILNNHFVSFPDLYKCLGSLSPENLMHVFVAFGVRANENFFNSVGDLSDWILKANDTSFNPLDSGYKKLIKDRFLFVGSVAAPKISGLAARLNKLKGLS